MVYSTLFFVTFVTPHRVLCSLAIHHECNRRSTIKSTHAAGYILSLMFAHRHLRLCQVHSAHCTRCNFSIEPIIQECTVQTFFFKTILLSENISNENKSKSICKLLIWIRFFLFCFCSYLLGYRDKP